MLFPVNPVSTLRTRWLRHYADALVITDGLDLAAGGFGQGAGEAADTVSRYLIERAEQYQPVVEMPTGIEVEIVFLDGVHVRSPSK